MGATHGIEYQDDPRPEWGATSSIWRTRARGVAPFRAQNKSIY